VATTLLLHTEQCSHATEKSFFGCFDEILLVNLHMLPDMLLIAGQILAAAEMS